MFTIDGEKYSKDPSHYYGDGVTYKQNSNGEDCVSIKIDTPTEIGEVTTQSAETAYKKVLAYCGASLWRDGVDARYMEEAATGTTTYTGTATKTGDNKEITHRPGIIDFVSDQGTYELESTSRPDGFDSDQDGMPDEWETANGLNPSDASDAKAFTLDERGWYSNLEVYLNSLVEDIMKAGNADALTAVDEYYPACTPLAIQPQAVSAIVSYSYYTLDGRRLDKPQPGIMIRMETHADGSVSATKVTY